MQLTIQITDNLPKTLYPFIEDVQKKALLYHAEELQNQVKINISGKILRKRTGALVTAWSVQPKVEKGGGFGQTQLFVLIRVNSKYARIHEGPDDPYATFTRIVPVRARCLYFKPEGSNRYICVPAVRIPARRYVTRAFEVVKEKSSALTRTAIRDAKLAVGGGYR
jgi:hypothetical protein